MSLTKLATIISSITAFLLLTIKLIIWFISGSIWIFSSAIDSLLDFFISIFNHIAIKNSEMPKDKKFNYWRWKIEALASLFEWLIIIFSWAWILYSSINKLINNQTIWYLKFSIIVMIISFILTLWLVIFLDYVAKKTNNLVIKSDSLHYKTDLYTNAWILLALIIIHFTWFYYIDWIIWITISIFIMFSATKIIKKWFLLLLDISLDKKIVNQIIQIINNRKEIKNYSELRTRESWKIKFVDVNLIFSEDIKLIDAHSNAEKIVVDIKKIDKNCEWSFNIHFDTINYSNKQ